MLFCSPRFDVPLFPLLIRSKRDYDAFHAEIGDCAPGRCTLMKCTVGPLLKEESVTFKIRSRLFTETQIKAYKDKVKVSSKLVTRITRLPYLADPSKVEYKVRRTRRYFVVGARIIIGFVPPQTHQVTTEVFPSEMAEGSIPWWVWLLAALFGLLLLALIIFCLYKVSINIEKRIPF